MEAIDPIIYRLAIFMLAIFVGYYVVWSVTPALHTPLMAVTNAISSVIIVGAIIAAAAGGGAIHGKPQQAREACKTIISTVEEEQRRLIPANPPSKGDQLLSLVDSCSEQFAQQMGPDIATDPNAPPTLSTNTWIAKGFGGLAALLAAVNIFGGFLVTQRMLAMYRKKEKPKAA